ncbi:MAG: asparagine synthase (glutamine-hydrolyzing), partial [Pseudonocardiaceae bacterium]
MCAAIEHRGPDSRGSHHADGVGLGIQRLRVIDLVTGDQPISNEDGTVTVVLNGEIYNFRELRERLRRAGHRFRTQTDTEVIVHLYEEKGPELVHD